MLTIQFMHLPFKGLFNASYLLWRTGSWASARRQRWILKNGSGWTAFIVYYSPWCGDKCFGYSSKRKVKCVVYFLQHWLFSFLHHKTIPSAFFAYLGTFLSYLCSRMCNNLVHILATTRQHFSLSWFELIYVRQMSLLVTYISTLCLNSSNYRHIKYRAYTTGN